MIGSRRVKTGGVGGRGMIGDRCRGPGAALRLAGGVAAALLAIGLSLSAGSGRADDRSTDELGRSNVEPQVGTQQSGVDWLAREPATLLEVGIIRTAQLVYEYANENRGGAIREGSPVTFLSATVSRQTNPDRLVLRARFAVPVRSQITESNCRDGLEGFRQALFGITSSHIAALIEVDETYYQTERQEAMAKLLALFVGASAATRAHPVSLKYDLARWLKFKAEIIELKGNVLSNLTDKLVLDRLLGRDTPAPESLTCELGLFGRDVVVNAP
jgi:hypothetical protein